MCVTLDPSIMISTCNIRASCSVCLYKFCIFRRCRKSIAFILQLLLSHSSMD